MKKLLLTIIFIAFVTVPNIFGATTFSLYDAANDGNVISSIPLDRDNESVDSNRKFTAGKVYIQIDKDNDTWVLIAYTKNIADSSNLQNTPRGASLVWKYRNAPIFGEDSDPLGTTISDADWSDSINLKYKYFVNSPTGSSGLTIAQKNYAKILDSTAVYPKRVQITFGLDMSSTVKSGTYSTTLEFELLTN